MKATANKTMADNLDRATTVSMQLEALMVHTYGGSLESFLSMNDDLKDNYLWLCAEKSSELKYLIEALSIANSGGAK